MVELIPMSNRTVCDCPFSRSSSTSPGFSFVVILTCASMARPLVAHLDKGARNAGKLLVAWYGLQAVFIGVLAKIPLLSLNLRSCLVQIQAYICHILRDLCACRTTLCEKCYLLGLHRFMPASTLLRGYRSVFATVAILESLISGTEYI